MFLRLVHVAGAGPETRARVALADLPGSGDGGVTPAVLRRFAAHQLVTMGTTSVQIAHEALLVTWPRLRSWLDSPGSGVPAWLP